MRTTLLHLSILVLAGGWIACGDSGGSVGTCMEGTKSTDPCPQTGTSCSSVGGVAVACCVGGQFEQQPDMLSGRMTTKCQCEQAAQGVIVQCPGGGAGGSGGGTSCGNAVVDSGEQCDGTNLAGQSCMMMGMGTGILACSPACTFDTSMCGGGQSTGGTGGGGSGG